MKNRLKKEDVIVNIPLPVIIDVAKLIVISYFLVYNSAKSKH